MLSRAETEDLVQQISDWVGSDPDHPVYRAAVVLLLGLGRRKHLDDLTQLSKYPKPFVKECLANLREAGVWRGESHLTYGNWEEEPVSFLLDTMVAAGIIVRVGDKIKLR